MVIVLADGPHAAGAHRVRLATAGLPGGVYLVRATFEAADGGRIVEARPLAVLR